MQRNTGNACAQRKDHTKRQGEGGHQQAKEKGHCRRNQTNQRLAIGLLAPRTVRIGGFSVIYKF